MAASQISTSVTIINSLLGFQAISINGLQANTALSITAGSKVEVASAFYNFTTDTTPNASSWTAVTTGNNAYVILTPSGSAGSQILSASWTDTQPEWNDSKQGYYTSAGSNIRAVAFCNKGSNVEYDHKIILDNGQARGASAPLVRKVLGIGDWDMDATGLTVVEHGLPDVTKIRSINVIIQRDDGAAVWELATWDTAGSEMDGGTRSVDATTIGLARRAGGTFDTSNFNATSFNRGWVTIEFEL